MYHITTAQLFGIHHSVLWSFVQFVGYSFFGRLCTSLITHLELLGLMVLQSLHNWSKPLFVVPLCSNCHGSQNFIQAGRTQGAGKHRSQQTLLQPNGRHIYSQFVAQTLCILSPRVLVGTISQPVFGHFDKLISISLYEIYSIIAAVSNFDFIQQLLR